jgi:uncharacterized protein (UPF0332 family)
VNSIQARLLGRADGCVAAARSAAAHEDSVTVANRAYYAMFYAAWSLVADEPDVGRRHRSVHSAFGLRYAKPGLVEPQLHRWLLDAFDLRQVADYDPLTDIEPEAVADMVGQADEFVAAARAFLDRRDHVDLETDRGSSA